MPEPVGRLFRCMTDKDRLPPLACQDCLLGRFTVYGPTMDVAPGEIYIRRRGVMTVAAQKTFLREGDTSSEIHTLYSGWAFRYKQLPDGRRQILSFLIPGDSVTLEKLYFSNLSLPFSVKSLTPISVCTFDLQEMIELTRRTPAQMHQVATEMRDYVVGLNRRLADIGRRSALGRVAQLILELEERLRRRGLSQSGRFHFPVRQEHIADALGLTTVYVNRTLDKLRRDDVIAFDRMWMSIQNIDKLMRISEEE